MERLESLYNSFARAANLLQPIVLLIFRLHWGLGFFNAGKGKFLHHEKTAQFFSSINIPFPDFNAWFVAGVECIGGLLLFIGLASRPSALLLTITMIVAYMSTKDSATVYNIFSDPDKFLEASPFFFLLTSVLVLAFGPGAISVDELIKRRILKKRAESLPAATQVRDIPAGSVR